MTINEKKYALIKHCNDNVCRNCPLAFLNGDCHASLPEDITRNYEIVFGNVFDPECITVIRDALKNIEDAVDYLEKILNKKGGNADDGHTKSADENS